MSALQGPAQVATATPR